MLKNITEKNKIFLTILLLFIFTINISFALSVSPNNEYCCYLYLYNKYYLFDLKEKKIIKNVEMPDYYDNVFFISKDKVAFVKGQKIEIMDSLILKPEAQFNFNQTIRDLKVVKENDTESFFLIFTDYSIRYFKYDKNKGIINLITQKDLVKYHDSLIKDNEIFVADNMFISIFRESSFLFFKWLSSKKIKLEDVVYSLDVGKNKYAVLYYVSTSKRKVSFYTLNGMEITTKELEGNYQKLWFDKSEKEVVLFDNSNSIKILSQNGEIRESNIYGGKIDQMQKFNEGFILVVIEDKPNFVILDSNFNM